MLSKKTVLSLCVVAVVAFTTITIAYSFEKASNVLPVEAALSTENLTDVEKIVDARIDANAGIKSPEQIKSIIDCNNRAKYDNIASYVAFVCENRFSPAQIKIINNILDSGTTIQTLNQVYDFWLTTDEPFSIVEEICALEDEFFSEFWYENAFNSITDNEHGVLSDKEVREYLNKNLTYDDILTANTLSRKKGQNINNILNRIVDGEKIEDIICEIYDIDFLPEAETNLEKINKIIKSKKYNIASEVVNSDKLTTFVDSAEANYGGVILDKIYEETTRLKVDVPEADDEYDAEMLKKSGLPYLTIKALLNKGYTPDEIAKVPEFENTLPHIAVKKAREVLK